MRYREVKILKEAAAASKTEPGDAVAIVSCDEKPGIQAIANTAPDLPPQPGAHAIFARDHEYKRHGTVSPLAGIDLLTGQVHALVRDRSRSCEFIEFLQLLDAAYPSIPRSRSSSTITRHMSSRRPRPGSPNNQQDASNSLHAQARFVAEPRRGLLFQADPLDPAPHQRRIQTGTQGSHHDCYGPLWTTSTIPWFTPGPISSMRPPDSKFKNAELADGSATSSDQVWDLRPRQWRLS